MAPCTRTRTRFVRAAPRRTASPHTGCVARPQYWSGFASRSSFASCTSTPIPMSSSREVELALGLNGTPCL